MRELLFAVGSGLCGAGWAIYCISRGAPASPDVAFKLFVISAFLVIASRFFPSDE